MQRGRSVRSALGHRLDTLDLFTNRGETFRGSLWLYATTRGVVSLGPSHGAISEAEDALESFSGLELPFTRETFRNGIAQYASAAYRDKLNVAVVLRAESGDVVSRAMLPEDWYPPSHPKHRSPRD